MDSVILILLEHGNLTDLDTLNLLSTCRTFRNQLNRARFTSEYDYDRVKHVPYLNSFTAISLHVTDNVYEIDKHITHITYETKADITHIPFTVTHVTITDNISKDPIIKCTIPENVVFIKIYYNPVYLDIQDGNGVTTLTLKCQGSGWNKQTFMRTRSKKPIEIHYIGNVIPLHFWLNQKLNYPLPIPPYIAAIGYLY